MFFVFGISLRHFFRAAPLFSSTVGDALSGAAMIGAGRLY